MAANSKRNPLLTKNGKIRLKPLTIAQLTEMMEKPSARPRDKAKLLSRIKVLEKRKTK